MEGITKESHDTIQKAFTLAWLLLTIICILLYSNTVPGACAAEDGTTLSLNLQDASQWLFGALLALLTWTARKIDKNQTTLFEKVSQHDKEIFTLKGAIFGVDKE